VSDAPHGARLKRIRILVDAAESVLARAVLDAVLAFLSLLTLLCALRLRFLALRLALRRCIGARLFLLLNGLDRLR
jgi:hypothetical protein